RGAVERDTPAVQEDRALAEALDGDGIVGHEDNRPAGLLEREDPAEALPLEGLVPHREHSVEEEDFRVQERGDREPEPHRHSRGIRPDGPVDRVLQLRERDDLIEALLDGRATQTLDRPVQEDVLASREIRVKPGAELEQGPDPTLAAYAPCRRLDD